MQHVNLPIHSTQMFFFFYCLFTVFIFVQKGQFILVPSGGFIVQVVVVDLFVIRLFPGTLHLQINLFIGVLELKSRYKVLFLKVNLGEVVHGFWVLLLVSLLLDMMYYHYYHAEKNQNGHQAYSHADGCQTQLLTCNVCVGARGSWRHVDGLALEASVLGVADAGRLAFVSSGTGPSIQTGLRGTVVCRLVTVAARVPRRTGAGVVVDAIYAGGAVGTRVSCALVDVDLTAQSCEAWATAAQPEVIMDNAVPT